MRPSGGFRIVLFFFQLLWPTSAAVFRCLNCDSSETGCVEGWSKYIRNCTLENDACFTSVTNGVLTRGCLSELATVEERAECTEHEGRACISCTEAECNSVPWLKCAHCGTDGPDSCTDKQRVSLCPQYRSSDRCYEIVQNDGEDLKPIAKGCESTLQLKGSSCEQTERCRIVDQSDNNRIVQTALQPSLQCLVCSSVENSDEKCISGTLPTQHCPPEDGQCYSRVLGTTLERNCISMLSQKEQVDCSKQDSTCVTCTEPGCNNDRLLRCVQCKKSQDIECINPISSSTLEPLFCPHFLALDDECFARIIGDDLERGCGSMVESICTGNNHCLTCDTDGCNQHTDTVLENVAKCFRCTSNNGNNEACDKVQMSGEECDQLEDDCFMRVQEGTLERNCLSSLSVEEQQKCTDPADRSCTLCDESGCNQDRWAECHQCDSSISKACKNEQSKDDANYCKSYQSGDKCYTKIADDGLLTRGCLSDVGSEGDLCEGAVACITCPGVACNNEPESSLNQMTCKQCTSADVGCVLGTVENKPCPQQDDACYTAVRSDSLLERGCLSAASPDMQTICNDDSDPRCIVCSEHGCNAIQWSVCYRCQSSETDDRCNHKLEPEMKEFCPEYSEQGQCYAAIQDGTVIRDCTDENAAICEGNNRCVACKDDACNDLPKDILNVVHSCHQCHSDVEDCDDLPEQGEECKERSDQCYTRLVGDSHLHRGCTSEIDVADCGRDESCTICTENNCNNTPWPKCFQCTNSTSAQCTGKQMDAQNLKYCQLLENTGWCYAMVGEMEFTRGCLADPDVPLCEDPEHCVECSGDGCNRDSMKSYFDPAFCLRCHSDIHDECLEGTIAPEACDDPDDVCFYRRASSKTIHRGCLSELTPTNQKLCKSTSSQSCRTCETNGCNTQKWRHCYTCSSLIDASCASKQTDDRFLDFCQKMDDDCFEDNTANEIRRGCGRHYCDHKKTCVECSTDACNSHAESSLQPTQCLVCDSSDPNCANGTTADHDCDYLDEPCFSMVRKDDVLERGCFSQLHPSYKSMCMDERDRTCVTCNGKSCNREPWRKCVQCRSLELDNYCSRQTSPLGSHFCQRFRRNDRCYAADVQGVVIRGCVSDFDPLEDPCDGLTEKSCYTCNTDHCNMKSLNGAAQLLQLRPTLLMVVSIILRFLCDS